MEKRETIKKKGAETLVEPRAGPNRLFAMRRGFTLTEILIAVGIVCVLAGLLFPVVQGVKGRAKHSECANNLHQLGEAEHLYANDHDGWVPPATTAADGFFTNFEAPEAAVDASPSVLRNALDPYVRSNDVWFCPTDPHAHQNVVWLGQRHLLTSYFFYPVGDGDKRRWPPKMQLMHDPLTNQPIGAEDVPLICDAAGIPDLDSDPQFATHDKRAYSNHPDRMVNFIRHDLSLSRKDAGWMMGTPEP